MAYEKNPDELGALWLKTGAKGDYMTGTINGFNVFCTPTKSENAQAPTWRVMKSTPTWRVMKSTPKDRGGDVPNRAPLADVTDSDIPF